MSALELKRLDSEYRRGHFKGFILGFMEARRIVEPISITAATELDKVIRGEEVKHPYDTQGPAHEPDDQ